MDTSLTCPQCHTQVRSTDYFCFNCGKNLAPKPLSTSVLTQAGIYLGSIILAPLGLVWGIRYIRQSEPKAKLIGVIAIVLTLVTLVVFSKLATAYIANVNEQVSKQLNGMQGF